MLHIDPQKVANLDKLATHGVGAIIWDFHLKDIIKFLTSIATLYLIRVEFNILYGSTRKKSSWR